MKYETIDISGGTNCSRYVGLSSFIFGDPCEPPKCPSNFILSLTLCLVIEVTAPQTPLSAFVASPFSTIVSCDACEISCIVACALELAFRNSFLTPPPNRFPWRTINGNSSINYEKIIKRIDSKELLNIPMMYL